MTPELKQRIEKEAKDHCDLHIGDKAKFPYNHAIQVVWEGEFDGYIAGATEYAEQVERLQIWKGNAEKILSLFFDYVQSHPDLKQGTSWTEFILNRAKAYDRLLEKTEKLRKALAEIHSHAADGVIVSDGNDAMAVKFHEISATALENYKKETK